MTSNQTILDEMSEKAFKRMKEFLFICGADVETRDITQDAARSILRECQKSALEVVCKRLVSEEYLLVKASLAHQGSMAVRTEDVERMKRAMQAAATELQGGE